MRLSVELDLRIADVSRTIAPGPAGTPNLPKIILIQIHQVLKLVPLHRGALALRRSRTRNRRRNLPNKAEVAS